jgi:hypothetical protein
MRLLTLTAAVLALAGLSSPTFAAEPPITNPNQLIESVTAESVSQLMTELGGQNVQIIDAGTAKIVRFEDGGTPYGFTPTGCSPQNVCTGLSLLVVVDNSQTNFPADTLLNASKENPLVSFFKIDNTKFAVGRIALVDGGVTKKHLAYETALFVAAYREAKKKLDAQLVASARPGPFQRASYGNGRLREIHAHPALLAQLARSFPKIDRPALGRR